MRFEDLLGVSSQGDGRFSCEVDRSLHGAFGGAFGGILAALGVWTSRQVAPGRRPVAVDCRFVRGLPAGPAAVSARPISAGRTMACVEVDITDERERLCTRCTVSLVDASSLADREAGAPVPPETRPFEEGSPSRGAAGVDAPILATLDARVVGTGERGVSTALLIPWDDDLPEESSCVAADLCVGAPVALALAREWVPHPNPDLSLRFCSRATGRQLLGTGRLRRIHDGVAAVAIEVWSAEELVALGASCSLLLGAR